MMGRHVLNSLASHLALGGLSLPEPAPLTPDLAAVLDEPPPSDQSRAAEHALRIPSRKLQTVGVLGTVIGVDYGIFEPRPIAAPRATAHGIAAALKAEATAAPHYDAESVAMRLAHRAARKVRNARKARRGWA